MERRQDFDPLYGINAEIGLERHAWLESIGRPSRPLRNKGEQDRGWVSLPPGGIEGRARQGRDRAHRRRSALFDCRRARKRHEGTCPIGQARHIAPKQRKKSDSLFRLAAPEQFVDPEQLRLLFLQGDHLSQSLPVAAADQTKGPTRLLRLQRHEPLMQIERLQQQGVGLARDFGHPFAFRAIGRICLLLRGSRHGSGGGRGWRRRAVVAARSRHEGGAAGIDRNRQPARPRCSGPRHWPATRVGKREAGNAQLEDRLTKLDVRVVVFPGVNGDRQVRSVSQDSGHKLGQNRARADLDKDTAALFVASLDAVFKQDVGTAVRQATRGWHWDCPDTAPVDWRTPRAAGR